MNFKTCKITFKKREAKKKGNKNYIKSRHKLFKIKQGHSQTKILGRAKFQREKPF